MQDNVGHIYILNDSLKHESDKVSINYGENVFYEVIRVIDGVPLFFEEHYQRLKSSLSMLSLKLNYAKQDLKASIKRLLEANKLSNCNVKINVFEGEGKQNSLLYISKSYYPPQEEIDRGVSVSLLNWERSNPNAKLINSSYKEAVSKRLAETNAFELLLVNDGGKITEGSKSNVFFVKGSRVFTAPEEYVLKGITRQYIIDVCNRLELEVVETLINTDSLNEMEGLFISGTSIKVLPVSNIDDKCYSSSKHPTILDIRNQFDRLIEEYVLRHKE